MFSATWSQLTFFIKNQHGFQSNVSTTTQLISVVHDFAAAIDNHQQIDAIFLDLSKAFDRVLHGLLIDRPKEVGLSDIGFVVGYINIYTI